MIRSVCGVDVLARNRAGLFGNSENLANRIHDLLQSGDLKEIVNAIGEVLAVAEQPRPIPGQYIYSANTAYHIQLNADGSFALVQGGGSYTGRFSVNANPLNVNNNLQLLIAETG